MPSHLVLGGLSKAMCILSVRLSNREFRRLRQPGRDREYPFTIFLYINLIKMEEVILIPASNNMPN